MTMQKAVVFGSIIIAIAILFVGRYQLSAAPNGVWRLNTWTGQVSYCVGNVGCS